MEASRDVKVIETLMCLSEIILCVWMKADVKVRVGCSRMEKVEG